MFNKVLFIGTHQLGNVHFYPTFKKALKSQWMPYEELKKDQESQLRKLIIFSYHNVPYYHSLFKGLNLQPDDIKKIEDLEKLPVLTKDIILKNYDDFKPVNLNHIGYTVHSTGGSTGTPLKYRVSTKDRFVGGAMMYRGWSYGGYELGDKMIFLAGSSLDVGTKPYLVTKFHEIARNLKKLSSFDMSEVEMKNYFNTVNSFKPLFFRGYASAFNLFAKYVDENNLDIQKPNAIFSTSEKLYPQVRRNVENVFDCPVYDNYGLFDGGVSAYECPEHCGLHIDTERSIMEIVDEEGSQLEKGVGNILATSLNNYAMPFIRYSTGDMGDLMDDFCSCGRGSKLLKEVLGRSVDILFTPEGKQVHGWFFLYIFWKYCKGIKEYQVVQVSLNNIVIKIVPDHDFDEKQLDSIRSVIYNKSHGWNIKFKFVDSIEKTKAGKHKFIISKMNN
jgi:Coenzyme F390 synthetase